MEIRGLRSTSMVVFPHQQAIDTPTFIAPAAELPGIENVGARPFSHYPNDPRALPYDLGPGLRRDERIFWVIPAAS